MRRAAGDGRNERPAQLRGPRRASRTVARSDRRDDEGETMSTDIARVTILVLNQTLPQEGIPMKSLVFRLATAGLVFCASTASARLLSDHLQCYKIKDRSDKIGYALNLDPTDPAFAGAQCTIKTPAKWLCLDTVDTKPIPD